MQQTLLQKASTFIRDFNLEMPSWGSIFSHALIDRIGNIILQSTVAKGQSPTLTLDPSATLVNWTRPLGGAIDSVNATTPLTGASISANANGQNEIQYIAPAGTIAALTYVFPTDANSRIGQSITLFSTHIVTALTITSTSQTLIGTALTALAVDMPYTWRKVAASTWIRVA
jgi:hypothetical protein